MQRFQIRVSPLWWPLLLGFGVTSARAWVELGPERLVARLGWYRFETARANIESAERFSWPWYAGIGWRSNLRGVLGLIGSTEGVVHLHLKQPQHGRLLLLPITVKDFYVSLEDPAGFLAALG